MEPLRQFQIQGIPEYPTFYVIENDAVNIEILIVDTTMRP